jgi:hypothetical protein
MYAFPPNDSDHVTAQAKTAHELGLVTQRQRFVVRRPTLSPRDYRILWIHAIIAAGLTGVAVFGFLDVTTR